MATSQPLTISEQENEIIILEEATQIENLEPISPGELIKPVSILTLGETGSGKSRLINSLLQSKLATVTHGPHPSSHPTFEDHIGNFAGHPVKFIDTSGLGDVNISEGKQISCFHKAIQQKVDIVFICHPLFGRYNKGIHHTIKLLAKGFASNYNIWKKCVLVLTKANLYSEYYDGENENVVAQMTKDKIKWANLFKAYLIEFGVKEEVIEDIPVCVVGREKSYELPTEKHWMAPLIRLCNEVVNKPKRQVSLQNESEDNLPDDGDQETAKIGWESILYGIYEYIYDIVVHTVGSLIKQGAALFK